MEKLSNRPNTKEWDRFISGIWASLREEYSLDEVDDMLSKASYDESPDTITIVYENGKSDVFHKILTVVHSSQI